MDSWALIGAGIILILAGFALIFIGTLKEALSTGGGRVEGGGVVMIGPIPIIFGSSAKMAIIAAVLAIALMVLALLMARGAGHIAGGP